MVDEILKYDESPRCDFCNDELQYVGEEVFNFGDEVDVLPIWECAKQPCKDAEAEAYDMGKAIAKGEL